MSKSQIKNLEDSVSELSYNTGTANISPEFYREAVKMADKDAPMTDYREWGIDNVVLDPSVVLQACANTKWTSSYEIADERIFNALDEVYGSELAYHWTENSNNDSEVIGTFTDEVGASQVFEELAKIKDIEFHYPDHMINCINGKFDELKEMHRDGDLNYEPGNYGQVAEDLRLTQSKVITGIKKSGNKLPVMRNHGVLGEYRKANFSNKNIEEDDLIETEAKKLDGITAVATFDEGFTNSDILGLPPQLLRQLFE